MLQTRLTAEQYSTYAFGAFAAAHIANTSLIPLLTQSVPASEPYLLLTRPYYQGYPFEPLLIVIPAYAHVLSGLAIRVYRRNLAAKRYGGLESEFSEGRTQGVRRWLDRRFWPAVSGTSALGWQLVPLLAGHSYLNRILPGKSPGGSSNVSLSYVSHAFARHPVIAHIGFTLLLCVGCFHFTWGAAKWLSLSPTQSTSPPGVERQLSQKRRWYVINAVAAGITGIWMAGSFGVIARGGRALGWVGRMFDDIYKQIPVVGSLF